MFTVHHPRFYSAKGPILARHDRIDDVPQAGFLRRFTPEPVKGLYRRLRDKILRTTYNPRRYWSKRGRTYMSEFPPAGDRSAGLITSLLSELRAESLLEVGCGYGRYLKAAREALSLRRICGVDISDTQIASAREFLKDHPNVELAVSPATKLAFTDNSFDAVLTYGLMIHLRPPEVRSFLAEARRVGRHWGLFVESSIHPDRPHLNPHYYFSHDYATVFARSALPVERRIVIHEHLHEYLYLVRLGG